MAKNSGSFTKTKNPQKSAEIKSLRSVLVKIWKIKLDSEIKSAEKIRKEISAMVHSW